MLIELSSQLLTLAFLLVALYFSFRLLRFSLHTLCCSPCLSMLPLVVFVPASHWCDS